MEGLPDHRCPLVAIVGDVELGMLRSHMSAHIFEAAVAAGTNSVLDPGNDFVPLVPGASGSRFLSYAPSLGLVETMSQAP